MLQITLYVTANTSQKVEEIVLCLADVNLFCNGVAIAITVRTIVITWIYTL